MSGSKPILDDSNVDHWVVRSQRLWETNVAALRAYVETHGAMPSTKEPGIGPFLHHVRADYRKRPEARQSDRAADLESIPGWTWLSQRELLWESFRQQAEDWYSLNSQDPPHRAPTTRLAAWISRQRKRRREGSLSEFEIAALERTSGWQWVSNWKRSKRSFLEREVGFFLAEAFDLDQSPSGVNGASGQRWQCDVVFALPRVIVEIDGRHWHRDKEEIDRRKTEDLERAGWSVLRCREEPLSRLGALDVVFREGMSSAEVADRVINRLRRCGVEIGDRRSSTHHRLSQDLSHLDDWYEQFDLFKHYVDAGGPALPVATEVVEDGWRVGQWVAWQRRARRLGRLRDDKIRLLETVPGWEWELKAHTRKVGWHNAFEMLRDYLTHADTLPLVEYVDESGFTLGQWVAKQRTFYRAGKLSGERVDALQSLAGWSWEPGYPQAAIAEFRAQHEQTWGDNLARYQQFCIAHGHHPRGNHANERPLASWAATQRMARRKGALTPDREARLEAIPGWHWGHSRAHTPKKKRPAGAPATGSAQA